jgi:hypothetical protein
LNIITFTKTLVRIFKEPKVKRFPITIVIILSFLHYACSIKGESKQYSDTVRIVKDLETITKTQNSRNYLNIETLNFVAQYIYDQLAISCDTVYFQRYIVNGIEYKNVVGIIGSKKPDRIVIGAHYDVAGDQEGADDNASGVAGLLELARLISKDSLKNRIDLVAFTLEEPPFFRTEQMGSFIHAKSLFDNGENIRGMICLEMIGYFSDNKNSQEYPIGFLRLFYGNKGDYITVVQKFGNGRFGRQVKRKMKNLNFISTKSFKSFKALPGVDFSDHLNYWKFDYSAVMITNTAFYRNKNYHKVSDQLKTLDISKMSQVIDEVYLTIKKLK